MRSTLPLQTELSSRWQRMQFPDQIQTGSNRKTEIQMSVLRLAKNAVGRAKGYGGCAKCGDTWDWKANHSTYYDNGQGCFPLCEECWQCLTPETRRPYYEQLIAWWRTESHFPEDEERKILAAVEAGK